MPMTIPITNAITNTSNALIRLSNFIFIDCYPFFGSEFTPCALAIQGSLFGFTYY